MPLHLAALGTRLDVNLGGPRATELEQRMRALWSRCIDEPAQRQWTGTAPIHRRPGLDPGAHRHLVDPGSTRSSDSSRPSSALTVELLNPGESLTVTADHLASPDLERLMNAATQAITHALIGTQAGRLLMLHAGAVCHPSTGRSLVYVAAGGTGKSTLARELGRRYGYLTDETVAIERDAILPYPKPLSLRVARAATKVEHAPDALGLLPAAAGPTVARIVLLERSDDYGDEPEVIELGMLDAIIDLAPQSSSLYKLPRGLQAVVDVIEATGPVLRVRYREAGSLASLAAELIGKPS